MRARPALRSRLPWAAAGLLCGARVLLALSAVALPACSEAFASTGAEAPGPPVRLFDRPWRWTDEKGADVVFSRWRGAPLIVTAVYTSCTERCPLTVEKLRRVDDALRRRKIDTQVVLVTLDPDHDTLERLQHFKESRNVPASWRLLRGGLEETRELARMLRVRAIYDDGHIDHDVRIAVFNGEGLLVRSFTGWDFDDNDAIVAK
jgi:cytochrome oxidase Cu insertion factor (SCO1/SenC/PrrC family)